MRESDWRRLLILTNGLHRHVHMQPHTSTYIYRKISHVGIAIKIYNCLKLKLQVKIYVFGSGMVGRMYSSPSQSGDWGQKIAWTQEFNTSLNSMANLVLEKTKQKITKIVVWKRIWHFLIKLIVFLLYSQLVTCLKPDRDENKCSHEYLSTVLYCLLTGVLSISVDAQQ